MAPRTTYANLSDGLQNLSLWDASLADMGKLGITPCTAAGTNAIILTAIATAFAPAVSSPPQQLQQFSFVATATSTGSVTVNGLKLYKEDGTTQAAANDILVNVLYGAVYNSALNSGAGGYQIAFPITSIINPIISGATITNSTFSGVVTATGLSTYNGNAWTTGTGTLTLGAGKTLTASNTLTFTGTDGSTVTLGAGGTVLYSGGAIPGANITATTNSANALAVGPSGITNPAFNVDASAASAATGIGIVSAAAAGGVALSVLSSGTNEGLVVNAKGSGGMTFGNVSTGGINIVPPLSLGITGSKVGSVVFGNLTSGTLTLQPATGALGGTVATLVGGVYNVLGDNTTQTLTNKTFDSAGAGNVLKVSGVTVSAGQFPGEVSTGSATAGNVGEYVSATVLVGSAVSLVTGTAKDVTTISLTAGDWDVDGNVVFQPAGTTTQSANIAWISTTANTLPTAPNNGAYNQFSVPVAAGLTVVLPTGRLRLSLSGTTTVSLGALANFAVSTETAYGFIGARRRR